MKRRFRFFNRDRVRHQIQDDYFATCCLPRFDDREFERRFRISKGLFQEILTVLQQEEYFFRTSFDAAGRESIDPRAKVMVALRILGHGDSADNYVDSFQMGESTILECIRKWLRFLINQKHSCPFI